MNQLSILAAECEQAVTSSTADNVIGLIAVIVLFIFIGFIAWLYSR